MAGGDRHRGMTSLLFIAAILIIYAVCITEILSHSAIKRRRFSDLNALA